MADLPQVMEALRAADKAGNVEDARRLAQIANDMRSQSAQEPETDYGDMAKSALSGAADLLTFDQGHKVGGALSRIAGNDVTNDEVRAEMDRVQSENPGSSIAGGAAAGFVPGLGVLGRGNRVLRGAAAGAGYEGVHQTINDDKYDIGDIALSGAAGAAGGAVGVGAGKLAGKVLKKKPNVNERSIEASQNASKSLSRALASEDRLPVTVLQEARDNLSSQIDNSVLSNSSTKKARAALKDVDQVIDKGSEKGITTGEANDLLHSINNRLKKAKSSEKKIIGDFKRSANEAIVGVKAPKGFQELGTARTQFHKMQVSNQITKVFQSGNPRRSIANLMMNKTFRDSVEKKHPEIWKMLEDSMAEPNVFKRVLREMSRVSPTAIMYNAVRSPSYAALQSGMKAAGKFGSRGYARDRSLDVQDILMKGLMDTPRNRDITGLAPVGTAAGIGIFGGIE